MYKTLLSPSAGGRNLIPHAGGLRDHKIFASPNRRFPEMTESIIGHEKSLARIDWLKKAPEKYIKSLGKYTECTWKVHGKYMENTRKVHQKYTAVVSIFSKN